MIQITGCRISGQQYIEQQHLIFTRTFSRIKALRADLGGGNLPPFLGIRPPADHKGLYFGTFQNIRFWPTDPEVFQKTSLASIYTNVERERAPKNVVFFKICILNSVLGALGNPFWST